MSVLPASHAIQDRLKLYSAGWNQLAGELWSSPELSWRYAEMLKLSYQVIRASTTLLGLARDRAELLSPNDPVSAKLAPYLVRHVEEERGHDDWLLDDLRVLGISAESVQSAVPSPHIAGMVGAQHYWILHTHPVAILGYIAVLEGEPPDEGYFMDAARRSSLPEAAFSTLRYHSRVDRQHWGDLLELIDDLPLEPWHLSLIGLSALHTCNGMEASIRQVLSMPSEVSRAV